MVKKRIIIVFVVLSVMLCACSEQGSSSKSSAEVSAPEAASVRTGLDAYRYNNQIAGRQLDYAEGNYAYYYVPLTGNMIYYMDKQSGDYGPLCSRPDCLHDTNECMAYVGQLFINSLCYWEGKLYWVSVSDYMDKPSVALWSVNEDGSGRKILVDLTEQLYTNEYRVFFCAIDRGKLFLISDTQSLKNESPIDKLSVLVLDLNSKKMETIFQEEYLTTVFASYSIQQDAFFFLIPYVDDQNRPVNELYCWNMKTGELTCLMKDTESGKPFREFWMDQAGTCYFCSWNSDTGNGEQRSRVYCMRNGKAEAIPSLDIFGYEGYSLSDGIAVALASQMDGNIIALKRICIKKFNGETIYEGEISMPEIITESSVAYGGNLIYGNEHEMIFEVRAQKAGESVLRQYLVYYQAGEEGLKPILFMEHMPVG